MYDSIGQLINIGYFESGKMLQTGDTSDFRMQYVDYKSIHLLLPIKWSINYNYKGALLVAGKPGTGGKNSIPVDVTLSNIDTLKGETLDMYMNENLSGLQKDGRVVKVIEKNTYLLNNREVAKLIFASKYSDRDAEVAVYCILNEKAIYTITCITPMNEFPFYKEVFQNIIKSFTP